MILTLVIMVLSIFSTLWVPGSGDQVAPGRPLEEPFASPSNLY